MLTHMASLSSGRHVAVGKGYIYKDPPVIVLAVADFTIRGSKKIRYEDICMPNLINTLSDSGLR